MIKIKDYDFEMEQLKEFPFFDLSFLATINAGKENERKEMKLVASGLKFEEAIKQVVSFRLNSEDTTCSISEYLKKYKEVVDEVINNIEITDIESE